MIHVRCCVGTIEDLKGYKILCLVKPDLQVAIYQDTSISLVFCWSQSFCPARVLMFCPLLLSKQVIRKKLKEAVEVLLKLSFFILLSGSYDPHLSNGEF